VRKCRSAGGWALKEKFVIHMEEYGLLIGTKEEFEYRFDIFR